MMGNVKTYGRDDAYPRHRVQITRPFYLGKYVVTQQQWKVLMGSNPSKFKGANNPVESVTWEQAQEFIHRLNKRESVKRYRLPTEAEWEYAARADTTTDYCFGDDIELLDNYGWGMHNSGKMTHPVGQKQPNAWGLFDMHGNVWEWVADRYDEHYYAKSPLQDPTGPASGNGYRVLRGCWWILRGLCGSADRDYAPQWASDPSFGFRVALELDGQASETLQKQAVVPSTIPKLAPFSHAPRTYMNSSGMEFVLIQPGTFMMGHPEGKGEDREEPQHQVTITRPFYMGKYPVTQKQWQTVMGNNPSHFNGVFKKLPDNPVEMVSWLDTQEFIRCLNQKEGHTRYRLPTEAEWEYAARAGSNTAYFFGDNDAMLERYAWYGEDFKHGSTHPVGLKLPNPWGLYDIYGNIFEWVHDWYSLYNLHPTVDPQGPCQCTRRVYRGSAWYLPAIRCFSASRCMAQPNERFKSFGFRLALSVT